MDLGSLFGLLALNLGVLLARKLGLLVGTSKFGLGLPLGGLDGVPLERPCFRVRFLDLDLGSLLALLDSDLGESSKGLGCLLDSLLGAPLG